MFFALLAIAAIQSGSVDAETLAVQKQLRVNDQALLDAIAPGDRSVWERLLAKDAVYVDENGAIMRREGFLAALKPLPKGSSGHIAIIEYQADIRGGTAVVIHRDDEREDYHGIPLRAEYLMTETWLKEGSEWRLALVHAYVVAKDPPAIKTATKLLSEYEGHYRAAPDLAYTVRRDGDHLVATRDGGAATALARETIDVFFVPGQPRERRLFRRDAHNKVVDFVDRREGEDLVFIRGE